MGRVIGRLLRNCGFWTGVGIGLGVVIPNVLRQHGVMIGIYGETWLFVAGYIAWLFMFIGVFSWDARFVYTFMALGVVVNGLFYAAIASAVSGRLRRMRGTRSDPDAEHEP